MSEWIQFPQDDDRPKNGELVLCAMDPWGSNATKCYYMEEGWGGAHFIRQDTMSPYMVSCFWRRLPPLAKLGYKAADNLTSLLTVLESFIKGKTK